MSVTRVALLSVTDTGPRHHNQGDVVRGYEHVVEGITYAPASHIESMISAYDLCLRSMGRMCGTEESGLASLHQHPSYDIAAFAHPTLQSEKAAPRPQTETDMLRS